MTFKLYSVDPLLLVWISLLGGWGVFGGSWHKLTDNRVTLTNTQAPTDTPNTQTSSSHTQTTFHSNNKAQTSHNVMINASHGQNHHSGDRE